MRILRRTRKQTGRKCAAVIVAAGAGTRMQGVDKILTPLAGRPVLVHTVSAFEAASCVDEIYVVVRKEQMETVRELVREYGLSKVRDVVAGGATRAESVRCGLSTLSRDTELVAVQDGARPLVTEELIGRTVEKAAQCHAAAPAIPVKDTVKTVDETGRVTGTPDRETLRAVQTPQVFQRDLLLAAWEQARQSGTDYTDDCGAMEAMGVPVYLVQGSEENIKITTQMDMLLAEHILERRETYESWTRV